MSKNESSVLIPGHNVDVDVILSISPNKFYIKILGQNILEEVHSTVLGPHFGRKKYGGAGTTEILQCLEKVVKGLLQIHNICPNDKVIVLWKFGLVQSPRQCTHVK